MEQYCTGSFYYELDRLSTTTPTTIDFGFSSPVGTDSFNGPAGVTSIPPTPAEIAATDIDAHALGNSGWDQCRPFDFAAEESNDPISNPTIGPGEEIQPHFLRLAQIQHDDTTIYSVYTDNTY